MSKFVWLTPKPGYELPNWGAYHGTLMGVCANKEIAGIVQAKGEFIIDLARLKPSDHTRMINSVRRGFSLSKTGPVRRVLDLLSAHPHKFGLNDFPPVGYLGKQVMNVPMPIYWKDNPDSQRQVKEMTDNLLATAFLLNVNIAGPNKQHMVRHTFSPGGYVHIKIDASGEGDHILESITNRLSPVLSQWGELLYPKRKHVAEFLRSKPKLTFEFDAL